MELKKYHTVLILVVGLAGGCITSEQQEVSTSTSIQETTTKASSGYSPSTTVLAVVTTSITATSTISIPMEFYLNPHVKIVKESNETFYCEEDSDCKPQPGSWRFCVNNSFINEKQDSWGTCRGCFICPKQQSCYCIENTCVGEKRFQCDQLNYTNFRENENIIRIFYV